MARDLPPPTAIEAASAVPAEPDVAAPRDTDEILVREAQEGNVRAFEVLLLRHEAKVLRVLRFLGVPPADREDVAQEVFIRVFRHLGSFRHGRPFAGWVYRVTVNAAHDWRGRHGQRTRDEAQWSEGLERRATLDGTPREAAAGQDLKDRLEAALERLTERERAVFVLKEVEGLETTEVARSLGIASITVRRHLGLARERLQRELGRAKKE